jgi:hypothetical protein
MDEREKLAAAIGDPELVSYFYLDIPTTKLLDRLDALRLELTESQDTVPFNAQVKGYFGAVDEEGHPWILKPALDAKEILYHRLCGLAYLLDHRMGTLAAPTTLVYIGGKPYRATKVVRSSIQISSYSYLDQPFIDILRADLVNRWLYFDEDRNPNNYLVIHNKANKPFVVAIDYDKADLEAESMKITGNPDKFGWFRTEKTRFLTLLRPEHFEGVSLSAMEPRLEALMSIPEAEIHDLARRLLTGCTEDSEAYASKITANLIARRLYIDRYFRSMFKSASETEDICHNDDYSMFGESFLNQYKDKK